MNSAALIGTLAGIIGALAGVGAAIYATGYFEYLGGKRKLVISPVNKQYLMERILSLNSPSLPYHIKPALDTDLMIEWKIVDAKWYGIFAKERLRRTYRAYILLDELRHAVRYWEILASVEWVAGAPKIRYQKEFIRGRILWQKSWGIQYGIKEDGTIGKVYEYNFDIRSIRDPIKKTVEESGWEFVTVLRKKHATRKVSLSASKEASHEGN